MHEGAWRPFVHLFSSERGPDAVRPDSIRSCTWVQALLRVRRTSNSGRLPGSGGKVMQERSEKRFLHHFLRGRRVDWDEMPEGNRKYVMLGSRKPGFGHHFFT